jgi:hypothetical protein
MTESSLLVITAPNMHTLEVKCIGTAPFVQCAFGAKAIALMKAIQEGGAKSKTKKNREPKDFTALYESATHRSTDGWCGIPASSFRAAMISACRVAGVIMTQAKLCVFIEADGFDAVDGSPLVRIYGEREKLEMPVRNADGSADIRARPMWREWHCILRVRFDANKFDATSVSNLLLRAGAQVGIGEGRADSKKSVGMGLG